MIKRKYNSWQPEHNVSDDLIEDYENRIKKINGKKKDNESVVLTKQSNQKDESIQTEVQIVSIEIYELTNKIMYQTQSDLSKYETENSNIINNKTESFKDGSLNDESDKVDSSDQTPGWLNTIKECFIKNKHILVKHSKGG